MMELFATETHYVLLKGEEEEEALWVDRSTGDFQVREGAGVPEGALFLGVVYGFLGKLQFSLNADPRLIFIRQRSEVGVFRGKEIYRIVSVLCLPLEGDVEVAVEPKGGNKGPPGSPSAGQGLVRVRVPPVKGLGVKRMESKVDRRMLEELQKMFTEAESFFYSTEMDITNTLQRRHIKEKEGKEGLWEIRDLRFFWNYYMLSSLIKAEDTRLHRWVLPIIQGFVQVESCTIEHAIEPVGPADVFPTSVNIDIWVFSRRSRFQAGTRYLRRGVDEDGKVANYVETEQIIVYDKHTFSFAQLRGSIPVFWSQSNSYKYRPPPKIERDEVETYKAFSSHMEEQLGIYDRLVIVNLVEKSGKEKVLGDAYVKNVLKFNSNKLAYVTFDFHEKCRGMKFENVAYLTERLEEEVRKMGYCWIDPYGIVLSQQGTFRVNCVDCLDRTNVVQMHLAKEMLTYQLSKVGLIAPEIGLPSNIKKVMQVLWANNGDTISKQYAGTNALKGDFTRTGERKLAGALKDGMNSANRYYVNRFRDTSRQAAIDLMLGIRKSVTEADLADDKQPVDRDTMIEQIKSVIEEVKRCIVPPDEAVLGAWGLINGKSNEVDATDIDTILVLTQLHCYIAEYDSSLDSMTDNNHQIPLSHIEKMEIGSEPLQQRSTVVWNMFSSNNAAQTFAPFLKIYVEGHMPCFELRSSNVRFFNNVAVPMNHVEEMQEALRMVAEAIRIAALSHGKEIQLLSTTREKGMFPERASNFFNKYLTSNQQADVGLAKRMASVPLKTPQETAFSNGKGTESAESSDGGILQRNVWTPNMRLNASSVCQSRIIPMTLTPDLFHVEPHPSEGRNNDLVLSSCGILSPGRYNTAPYLAFFDEKETLAPYSPQIASPAVTPQDIQQQIHSPVSIASMFQRHRYSLPANTLGVTLYTPPAELTPIRSCTPEIKITEETNNVPTTEPFQSSQASQKPDTLNVLSLKRMSRSSEDVNQTQTTGHSFLKNLSSGATSGFKLPKIFNKGEDRATSQQNIVDSVSLKGSHSDNALRNNPFHKRDMVFTPLGKLAKGMQSLGANYLDPRKLKDSLIPMTKPGTTTAEDKELEEQKKRSETVFIDVE